MEKINLSVNCLLKNLTQSHPEKRQLNLLLMAIKQNNSVVVDTLLRDIKSRDLFYPIALCCAVQVCGTNIIDILLKYGADINQECVTGDCPLHIAAKSGLCTMVNHLLKKGADINKKTNLGLTPLHDAGSASVIDVLLDEGADLEAEDNCGLTPLYWAIEKKRPEQLVEHLIIQGAKLDTNKLKEKNFRPGKNVSELIVKCKVAKIDDDIIAKLDQSEQVVDVSFEEKCKIELGKLEKCKSGKLHFIELLRENYPDFSFFESFRTNHTLLVIFASGFPIYHKFLHRNYKRAVKTFESLVACTSNRVTIDVIGTPLNVTCSPNTKRQLMCCVPIDSLGTHKRMKAEVADN